MLDVFNQDVFSVISLTDSINKMKFVPGRIGQMGLFSETAVATTTIVVEERDGTLVLVSPTPRGGPGHTVGKNKRTARALVIPHFELNDAVMAEEVQGVRAWGSETATDTVMSKVAERLQILGQSLSATQEYSRVGAVKGIVTYADGSTLDLFSTFGVTQDAEIAFNLSAITDGDLRNLCTTITRTLADKLGGLPFTGIRAICGDAFFDDLMANPEVRATYLQTPDAAALRQATINAGISYGQYEFGGIVFENYRGAVGATKFVDTDECHIFPEGVPGLFRTVYAPADYIETVNTMGQPRYAKQYAMENGKGVNLDVQMNALEYCTRPAVLLKGKRGA